MTALPLNEKSIAFIKDPAWFLCAEGAVRSAKTVTTLVKWYYHILCSPEKVFLMSGATIGTLARNCLNGDFGFIALTGGKAKPRVDSDGSRFLQLGNKRIYYVGSDNAASYKKIRGLTIGAWYADEINLHHKDFVETAFARSFASKDRLNICTLNPSEPSHWFYTEYLDRYRDEKMPGYSWYHFTLHDNPAIDDEKRRIISREYTGVFYQRYVLGLRVRAEGACYPSFTSENIIDGFPAEPIIDTQIGVDIGGNKSATTFALVGYFMRGRNMCAVLIDEHYDAENKNTESVIEAFKSFVRRHREMYPISGAYVDSAEQLIRKSLGNTGVVNVYNSLKKPVVDRIRFADLMYSQKRFFIMRHCKKTIEAIQSASWNAKSQKEERLDDGTVNVDSLDAFEYAYENRMKDFI